MSKRETASKHLIMHTARTMAKKGGWASVSVRKIADQIQYTAPIIYEFFENREDLISQVIVDGLHTLRGLVQKRWTESGHDSLVPICLEYWKYSLKNPEIYEAMSLFASMKTDHAGLASETQGFCEDVSKMISEWAEKHSVTRIDAKEATDILWAQLHGLVSLGLTEQLGSRKRVDELIEKSVLFFEAGLRG